MGMLEIHRSGDFEKLKPYDGQVAAMDAGRERPDGPGRGGAALRAGGLTHRP